MYYKRTQNKGERVMSDLISRQAAMDAVETWDKFGCRWSKGKKKWYWTTDEYAYAYYKKPTMEQIRKMYGSQKVKLNIRPQLES